MEVEHYQRGAFHYRLSFLHAAVADECIHHIFRFAVRHSVSNHHTSLLPRPLQNRSDCLALSVGLVDDALPGKSGIDTVLKEDVIAYHMRLRNAEMTGHWLHQLVVTEHEGNYIRNAATHQIHFLLVTLKPLQECLNARSKGRLELRQERVQIILCGVKHSHTLIKGIDIGNAPFHRSSRKKGVPNRTCW